MHISTLLQLGGVKSVGGLNSKKRLFQNLGELAASQFDLDAAVVTDALTEREALGPTGVGKGVALPHARLEGLTTVSALFFRLEKPMEFDAVDRQPVDLVFALFAPKDAGVEHLKALALVSRTMRNSAVRSKLRSNDEPAILHAILTEDEASQAA